MVFKFFPTVTRATTVFQFAAVLVCLRIFLRFPTCALCVRVLKSIGTASVVLPVMSIDTEISLVVLVTKGTPHSFEMKHVEICVSIHFFKYVYGQFVFVMCKGTDFPILTLVNFVGICWAELWFVLLRVVEILDSIVTTNAIVTFGTLFFLITIDMRTHFRNVATRATSPVLLVWFMVVKALFRIMCSLVLARLCFEHV
jgi:hypothetical protein